MIKMVYKKSNILKLEQQNRVLFDLFSKYYDYLLWVLNKALKNVLSRVKIKNNSVILDAGCGTGNLLYMLSKNKTLKLEGVDINRNMLTEARKKLGDKIRLRLMKIEDLKDKNKFDYVFCTEAFHHFQDQKKVMKNFYSSLKRGGKLVLLDIDFGRIFNFVFNKLEPGNSKMNSKREFYNLFNKTGFKKIKQERIWFFLILNIGEK
ncbi:MAG: class I SAM-dependent methyltransferase [Candidatus Pacearchaeota archaeon]